MSRQTLGPPRKELDVRPVYPAAMREAGLTGVVPYSDFAIAAVDAVRQWRFTPTLLNNVPVEVVMTVSVRFDLED